MRHGAYGLHILYRWAMQDGMSFGRQYTVASDLKGAGENRNSIEVPEYPYAVEKDIELSVNDEMSDIDMEGISVMDESEDYDISLNAEVCEQILVEDTMEDTVGAGSKANIVEQSVGDRSDDKGSYEAYKKMTPLEKAQTYGFGELKSYDTVRSFV